MNKSDQDIITLTTALSNELLPDYLRICTLRNRGILYLDKKMYQMAIDDFTPAIEISEPNKIFKNWNGTRVELNKIRAKLYFFRGIAFIKIQNLDKGINDLKESLGLYPKIIENNKFELNILSPDIRGLIASFLEI